MEKSAAARRTVARRTEYVPLDEAAFFGADAASGSAAIQRRSRLVAQLTWNTFRDHPILEYEGPKYDADLARPNVYVALDQRTCARKVELLRQAFPSQASRTSQPCGSRSLSHVATASRFDAFTTR